MPEATTTHAPPVEFVGVRFGPDDVTELDGAQVMVRVLRQDITGIALRNGFHSAHPFIQVIAGGVLLAIGLLPTFHFAHWLIYGGTFSTIEALMMGFVFLGPWVMIDALKRGPYLEVRTATQTKKLAFDRKADRALLAKSLEAAEELLGYEIDRGTAGDTRPAALGRTEVD